MIGFSRGAAIGLYVATFTWTIASSPIESNVAAPAEISALVDSQPNVDSLSYVTQAAIDAFENHGDCQPEFFDLTQKNLEESDVTIWYNDLMVAKARQDPEAYKKFGEWSLFAREVMQMPGFECNFQSKGCSFVPSCKEVTDHLQRRKLNLSTPELLDKTRKIYFTFMQMDTFAKFMSSQRDLLGDVQTNIDGFIMSIIVDFTTQADTDAEISCMLIKFAHDLAWTVAATALGYGLGAIPSGAGAMIVEGTKVTTLPGNKALQDFHQFNNIQTAISLVKEVAGMQVNMENMRWEDDWYGGWSDQQQKENHLIMNQQYLNGICSEIGGDMPNQNLERTTKMNKYVANAFMENRAILERTMKAVTKGDALKWNATYTALYLQHEEMFKAVQRFKSGHSEYERKMTQLFKEQLISASLASSKCYQKCAHKPGDLKTSDVCKSKWFNVDSRYCPEDDPFTACQVQCFTTQNTGNREKVLIGKMTLPQYHVSVQHVLKDSLHHYNEFGNAIPSMGQTIGSGEGDILTLDGKLMSNVTALALPVCHSTTVRLAEFDNKAHFGHKYNLNQQFPCSCGDWRSSETADFLSRMGLGANQTDFKSGAAWELFTQICPHNLKERAPATRYLAYCGLGIQFPDKSTGKGPASYPKEHPDHWVHNMHHIHTGRGAHKHCEAIYKQMEGMDEKKGNFFFCKKSTPEIASIFKEERAHAENARGSFIMPYKVLCKKWMKDNKED